MEEGGIRRFYERNTRLFLAFGGGRRAGAIHREVWGKGVTNRNQALQYVNKLLVDRLLDLYDVRRPGRFRVLDLGCGVGGTLFYALERLPFTCQGVGVTVSPAQVAIARRRALTFGLSDDTCTFVEADFNRLPELGRFDAAWAVEAFVHGRQPRAFFRQIWSRLYGGGRCYIVDDFLTTARDNAWIRRFRDEWMAESLMTLPEALALAGEAGFRPVEHLDLTPLLRLGRFRDRVIRRVMRWPAIQRLSGSYKKGLSGGDALQKCLQEGWIAYRLVGLEKPAA